MYGKKRISNKWWKLTTIHSKEMKETIRGVEGTMKENREKCMLLEGDFNRRIGEREARNWEEERGDGKKNPKVRWKIQRGRD
jgi:hypothetical protein